MWTDNDKTNRLSNKVSQGSTDEADLELMYVKHLTEIAMSRFAWSGLPEGMEARFIEKLLHFNGLAVFFENSFYDKYFVLQGNPSGILNVYDNPTSFTVWGNGMNSRKLNYSNIVNDLKECVPIWANYSRTASIDVVRIYAKRLARIDRTLDINATNARTPRIFKGTENMRLSALNLNRQINNGAEFLMITDQMVDSIETLDMGIDADVFEKMHVYRTRLYNECMGFLGIDNANSEKKERLVEGELDANDEQTSVSRSVAMNAREYAAEEINAKYGLNIHVEYVGTDKAMNNEIGDIPNG